MLLYDSSLYLSMTREQPLSQQFSVGQMYEVGEDCRVDSTDGGLLGEKRVETFSKGNQVRILSLRGSDGLLIREERWTKNHWVVVRRADFSRLKLQLVLQPEVEKPVHVSTPENYDAWASRSRK